MINAPSAALPRPPANCPQVLIMVYFFLADFDLVLPDLEGVVLTAPDLGVFGTVGATAGAAAGAGAGMVAGGDVEVEGVVVGGVVSPGTGIPEVLVASGGSSGFLNGSSQVCRT